MRIPQGHNFRMRSAGLLCVALANGQAVGIQKYAANARVRITEPNCGNGKLHGCAERSILSREQ